MAEGYEMKPGESVVNPLQIAVTPDYFETIGTPLLRGRFFDARDNEAAQATLIVDERVARKFWPGADPIGKRMYVPDTANDFTPNHYTKWLTVVGVVREVRLEDLALTLSFGAVYFPAAQKFPRCLYLVLKTFSESGNVVKTLRARIRELDPEMPLDDIRPLAEYVTLSLIQRRAVMLLATSFGIVSLFLAAVGIYGVLAVLVTQRFREIGIRMALGSTSLGIFAFVLREGILLVARGLFFGFAGIATLEQVLQSQLYGVSATDPTMIAIAAAILSAIALSACAIPAGRATRLEPVMVLNQQ